MARSNREAPFDGLSADEQAQIDQMRDGDPGPVTDEEAAAAAASDTDAEASDEAPVAAQPEPPRPAATTVPHAALHEERELRKAAEQRAIEAERARQTMEERVNILLHRAGQLAPEQQQQTPQPQIPPMETDPVGHLTARLRQTEQQLADLARAAQGRSSQDQQAQIAQALQMRTIAMENEFRAKAPDYDNAARYLAEARHKQLTIAGVTDPAERQAFLAQEAFSLAARAAQTNRNPAEIVYDLAKSFGYTPPAAAAPPAPEAADRIQAITQGQAQARTLGNARGVGPAGVTAQTLAAMSEEEFLAFAKKATPAQLRAVMGP